MTMLMDYIAAVMGQQFIDHDDERAEALVVWAQSHFLLARLLDSQPALFACSRRHRYRIRQDLARDHKAFADHDERRILFEINRLAAEEIVKVEKIILLKGAAYLQAGKQAAKGRRVSDLDILVSNSRLQSIERYLLDHDWTFDDLTDNPYDQLYYRLYMHELPPLRHKKRGSVLDVHHGILPPTHRMHVNTQALIDDAIPLTDAAQAGFYRLNDLDQFIHAAIHHLIDGQFDMGPRAIVELLDLFDDVKNDVEGLMDRAAHIGAIKAAAYALLLINTVQPNSVPASLVGPLKQHISVSVLVAFKCQLAPNCPFVTKKLSAFLLYCRSHFLRMPFGMLMKHFAAKIGRSIRQKWLIYRTKKKRNSLQEEL